MSKLSTIHYPLPSISSWLTENTYVLKQAGIKTARLDCLVLLEKVLGKDRTWILAHDDELIEEGTSAKLGTFITQRLQRLPLAYIVGSKEFYGRKFYVNEHVLIPRPESESMIDLLRGLVDSEQLIVSSTTPKLQSTSSKDSESVLQTTNYKLPTILDLGTGSGCLAITAKKLFPNAHVTGIDISDAALSVARKNARRHQVQIQCKKMDITTTLPKMPRTRPYVLLANLPYVPDDLITSPEITKEPALALFSGSDGLDHYRALWNLIAQLQHKPLAIITESLKMQHAALRDTAAEADYNLTNQQGLAQLFE